MSSDGDSKVPPATTTTVAVELIAPRPIGLSAGADTRIDIKSADSALPTTSTTATTTGTGIGTGTGDAAGGDANAAALHTLSTSMIHLVDDTEQATTSGATTDAAATAAAATAAAAANTNNASAVGGSSGIGGSGASVRFVAASTEDLFSLETFHDLIQVRWKAGKPFLMAAVQTRDKQRFNVTCWSYYDAYALNRLLYRRRGPDVLHRYHRNMPITVTNPHTNTEMINEVRYYSIDADPNAAAAAATAAAAAASPTADDKKEDKKKAPTDSSPAANARRVSGANVALTNVTLNVAHANKPAAAAAVGVLSATPGLGVPMPDSPPAAAASAGTKPAAIPTVPRASIPLPSHYTGRFIGTDYNFAYSGSVRQKFIAAAHEPQDFLTVEIAESFAAGAGAGNAAGGWLGGGAGGMPPPLFMAAGGAGPGAGPLFGPGGAAGRLPQIHVPFWRSCAFGFITAFYLLCAFLVALSAVVDIAAGLSEDSTSSQSWFWSFLPFLSFTVDRMISAMHQTRENKTLMTVKIASWMAFFLFPTVAWSRGDIRYVFARHLMDLCAPVVWVAYTVGWYQYMRTKHTLV